MRKGKNVIGQDVYTLSGGLKLQSVKDLLIGESNDRPHHDARRSAEKK